METKSVDDRFLKRNLIHDYIDHRWNWKCFFFIEQSNISKAMLRFDRTLSTDYSMFSLSRSNTETSERNSSWSKSMREKRYENDNVVSFWFQIVLEEVRLNDFQSSFETISLIVLDRWYVQMSFVNWELLRVKWRIKINYVLFSFSMTNNTNVDLLRCVTPDGQILLIESDRVESSRKTLNSIFQRRTGRKTNARKWWNIECSFFSPSIRSN